MSSFADYLENKLLDHVFGNTSYTVPSTTYIGLSTTAPTDSGGNITEPVGSNYSRVAFVNNTVNWVNAVGGAKSNGTAITFLAATGVWGTVTHFFIGDSSSGGNILAYGPLTVPKTVTAGDVLSFAVGDLDITMS